MLDSFGRKINYLRISVTDRCNLRCCYCMPEEGVQLLKHRDILSFDEIVDFTKIAVECGVDKVRITGGEPLVRAGICHLVGMLSKITGIRDLAMTTNGVLLDKYAQPLKDAGLQRINVSLDTTDRDKFRDISRGGNIDDVFRGIEAAAKAGLFPLKLNCVVKDASIVSSDAEKVGKYAEKNGFEVRYIHLMNLKTGDFAIVEGGDGGNCPQCNRLRLTANGMLRPCLFNDIQYNIREHGSEEAIRLAVAAKPIAGKKNMDGEFYNIGG